MDQATVYRYTAALGLGKYLAHEQPGCWDLLTSAQLAHLCWEVNATLYTDCQSLALVKSLVRMLHDRLTRLN